MCFFVFVEQLGAAEVSSCSVHVCVYVRWSVSVGVNKQPV